MGILEQYKMIEPEFIAYMIALISLAVSIYALYEMREAKEYGKQWIALTKQLKERLEEIEKSKRR